MRGSRRKPRESAFHVEGWHPIAAAGLGALGFASVAIVVLVLLLALNSVPVEPSWALPVFVTALGAGGAAGLSVKNLNLKRAESRRDTNLMFDQQFETGARLLGGERESEVVAGSLLLGSLLRESPRHAQACADLLCSALRDLDPPNLPDETYELLIEIEDEKFARRIGELNRRRNAITRAISKAISRTDAPDHLEEVAWDFTGTHFGDRAELRNCLFGVDTHFMKVTVDGVLDLTGSRFAGFAILQSVFAKSGFYMLSIDVEQSLRMQNCMTARDPECGVLLERAKVSGLTILNVKSEGFLQFDVLKSSDRVIVRDCTFSWVCTVDATIESGPSLMNVATEQDLTVRGIQLRKRGTVSGCRVGGVPEVSGVRPLGLIEVSDDCVYLELRTDDSVFSGSCD